MKKVKSTYFILPMVLMTCVLINLTLTMNTIKVQAEFNKVEDNNDRILRKNFGGSKDDNYYEVINSKDGGFVAVGYSNSPDGDLTGLNKGRNDAIIVKYDVNNNIQWKKNYGGELDDLFNDVVEADDGGFVAVGYSNSTSKDLAGLNKGGNDAIIVKYDVDGNIVWKKNFGGLGLDWYKSLAKSDDGGFIAVGTSNSKNENLTGLNKGNSDGIIVKYNANGNVEWNKNFGSGNNENNINIVIFNEYEQFTSEGFTDIVRDSLGNYIVTGNSTGSDGDLIGLNKGNMDGIIVKFDSSGNAQWNKNYGSEYDDLFNSIIESKDGGYVAVGGKKSNATIVKYDFQGNIEWEKVLSNYKDSLYNSIIEGDDGYVVSGFYKGDSGDENHNGMFIKYDFLGNVLWEKTYEGSSLNVLGSLIKTSDGAYVAVGKSDSNDGDLLNLNKGGQDAIIIKIKDLVGEINETVNKEPNIFTNKNVNVSINVEGDLGIKWIKDYEGNYTYSNNLNKIIDKNGIYEFIIKDNNLTEKKITINVDNIDKNKPNKPTINKIKESYVLKDNGDNEIDSSGIKEIQYSIDNGVTWKKYGEPIKWIYGENNIQAKVIDNAGNESEIENTKVYNTLPWIKSFGGYNYESYESVAKTKDNGYITVGYSMSDDKDLAGLSKGGTDALIVKYDMLGNVQWKKTFGGDVVEDFTSVICTNNNEYVAVGNSYSPNGDLSGIYFTMKAAIIVKYDSSGKVLFKKILSGERDEAFNSIALTEDGGYIVVGESNSTTGDLQGLNKGGTDGIIIKYDSLGNIQFKKSFGGSNEDCFSSIKVIKDGYIAVGYSESNDKDLTGLSKGDRDSVIVKYDLQGNVQWKKSFGGSKSDLFRDVIATEDNGYIAVGYSNSSDGDLLSLNKGNFDGIIVKYDSVGNILWKKNFGNDKNEYFDSVTETKNNEYIAVGYEKKYAGVFNNSNKNGMMVKYNYQGDIIEKRNFDGSKDSVFLDIVNTDDNGYIIVGDSLSYDGDLNNLNKGSKDAVILKIKEGLNDINYTVNKTPESYTKESVNINIKADSPYGVKWIRNDYGYYTYGNEYNESISENGKYLFKIKDNNLVEKTFTVDVNNIDKYKPNKPNIQMINNNFAINAQGDPLSMVQKDIIENFEGPSLSFNPISNGQWYKTEENYSSGKYSYRSPVIQPDGVTDFNVKFTIPENSTVNNFSFSYKIDSKLNSDWFVLYLDGKEIFRDSGRKNWQQYNFTIPPGNHTVKFQYAKDSGLGEGSDAVYIDNIAIKTGGEISVPSSGVKEVLYKLDQSNTWNKYNDLIPLNIGENKIQAKTVDNAGNESDVVELTEVLDGLEVVFNNNLIDFGIVDGPSKEKEITLDVISSENYSISINGVDDFVNETMKSIPLNILKVKVDDNPFQTMEKNKNIVLKDNVEKGNNNHVITFSIGNYIGNEKGKYKSNMDISVMQK